MSSDNEIDFTDAIITPLKQWVEIKMNLDDDVIDYLRYLAEKANQPFDNVLNHILSDLSSRHLELTDLSAEKIKAASRTNNHIILMDGSKAFARVEIISREDELPLSESISIPNPRAESHIALEMPEMESKYECQPV